jgi:class 3 adenylate cyclase
MSDKMAKFDEMLALYADADAEGRELLLKRFWDTFGRRCAVFVSDLSGFSRLTQRYSIIHFLSIIRQCRRLLFPLIEDSGGWPIKATADNMYAGFPTAAAAIETSIAMQRRLVEHNQGRHADEHIGLCVGIGYGDILMIEGHDFFGHELNLAFKLGEDVAEAGEILVTRAALDAAGPDRYEHEPRTVTVSGVTIPHGSMVY